MPGPIITHPLSRRDGLDVSAMVPDILINIAVNAPNISFYADPDLAALTQYREERLPSSPSEESTTAKQLKRNGQLQGLAGSHDFCAMASTH